MAAEQHSFQDDVPPPGKGKKASEGFLRPEQVKADAYIPPLSIRFINELKLRNVGGTEFLVAILLYRQSKLKNNKSDHDQGYRLEPRTLRAARINRENYWRALGTLETKGIVKLTKDPKGNRAILLIDAKPADRPDLYDPLTDKTIKRRFK
jgi:hypothetical protein